MPILPAEVYQLWFHPRKAWRWFTEFLDVEKESQIVAKESQNKEQIGIFCGFIVLQTLQIIKSFLIFYRAQYFCYKINPLLTKRFWSRWLDMAGCLVLFSVFMDLNFVLVHKNTKKELCQYPTMLTSPLVNNAYTPCISLKYKCSMETVKNKIPFPHWLFLFYTHWMLVFSHSFSSGLHIWDR